MFDGLEALTKAIGKVESNTAQTNDLLKSIGFLLTQIMEQQAFVMDVMDEFAKDKGNKNTSAFLNKWREITKENEEAPGATGEEPVTIEAETASEDDFKEKFFPKKP